MTKKNESWIDSTEKIWDATRKTLQTAGFKANQYKRLVHKKMDLASLNKKIFYTHADLGKLIDVYRSKGEQDIFAQDEVLSLFRRLDALKNAAILLAEEVESLKGAPPAEGTDPPYDEEGKS